MAGWLGRVWPWAGALCALLALLIFLPALPYAFVYDDVVIVEQNPRIQTLSRPASYFATSWWDAAGQQREYRPLVMASFALNYACSGPRPAAFRIVNLLLHALVTWLLWRLALALSRNVQAAAAAALIFAVHPLHVEVVSGIVGRAELMMAACFLAALLGGWRVLHAETARARVGWLALVFVSACGSMFSKEHGVLLVPALVGLLVFPRPEVAAAPAGAWGRLRDRAAWLRLSPAVGLAVLAFALLAVMRIKALGAFMPPMPLRSLDNPLLGLPGSERIGTALVVFLRIVQLHLVPLNQSPDYSYGVFPVVPLGQPLALAGGMLLLAMLAGLVLLRRRPLARFGLWLFFVTWLITSNLLLGIGTILGERLLYLPSAGYCLLVAALLFERPLGPPSTIRPASVHWRWGAVGLYALVLACSHFHYLPNWKNQDRFVAALLERVPGSSRAQLLAASQALLEGKLPEAEAYARRAITIFPGNGDALVVLANALIRLGRDDEAIPLLVRAWTTNPIDRPTAFLLLEAMGRRGQMRQAMAVLREGALAARRDYRSRLILAEVYLRAGEKAAAAQLLRGIATQVAGADRELFSQLQAQAEAP